MTRYIEVTAETHCPRGFRAASHRLSWDEAQTILDELAGAPADTGALLLRYLRDEDGYSHLRVVTEHDGREDLGAWAPLDTLVRLAEYRDAELEEQRQDEERELEAVEAGERLHQQAHAPGVIS